MNSLDSQPGIISSLGEIPLALTNNHNEVYYYWDNSRLKSSTLFHIDGHDDLHSHNSYEITGEDYYKSLGIAGFIMPAFFHGIVEKIYWMNPHSEERRLQDMTKILYIDDDGNYYGKKRKINQVVIRKKPFILDIDLDAFCCDKIINHVRFDYDGVTNWKIRLDETMKTLSRVSKEPNLVTLTLSNSPAFVPENLSIEVLASLLDGLKEVYGQIKDYSKLIDFCLHKD